MLHKSGTNSLQFKGEENDYDSCEEQIGKAQEKMRRDLGNAIAQKLELTSLLRYAD